MDREQGLAEIGKTRIIAIIRGIEREHAVPVAAALLNGGITVMEVTMNTPDAPETIRELRNRFDGRLFVGAGTVVDADDWRSAVEAGASFIVTPNTDEEVIRLSAEANIPVFPGAMTPTEIVRAWKAGATAVKIFPGSSLGIGYLKELQGPLGHIPMIAVGGVTPDNIRDFLQIGCYAVGIGNYLFDRREIGEGRYDGVERRARLLIRQAGRD
mgnify:FL=1